MQVVFLASWPRLRPRNVGTQNKNKLHARAPQANVVPAHTALLQQMAAPHAEEGAGVPWKLFYMVLLLGSFAITAYSLSVPMAQEKAAAWLGSSAGETWGPAGGVSSLRCLYAAIS